MKFALYSLPNCEHGRKIKDFLRENNLQFKEIIVNNEQAKVELRKLSWQDDISALKIIKSHSITVITGFDDWNLNQLIEHIKKYSPKIEM